MTRRAGAVAAIGAFLLAGCGGTHRSPPRSTAPVRAQPPPPFGVGNDQERGVELATAILRQRLRRGSTLCSGCLFGGQPADATRRERFAILTEAQSWTPTHLLVQFVGELRSPGNRLMRYEEIRVLIAVHGASPLALASYSEHTLRHPGGPAEQRTRVKG